MNSDVRQKLHEQQTVKYESTITKQKEKTERGVKRDCTEGQARDYQLHVGDRKQKPDSNLQFSMNRPCVKDFFRLLRDAKK